MLRMHTEFWLFENCRQGNRRDDNVRQTGCEDRGCMEVAPDYVQWYA